MTSFQVPKKTYGARALAYFLKFPILVMAMPRSDQRQVLEGENSSFYLAAKIKLLCSNW